MLRTHIQNATKLLAERNIDTPRLAAEILMAHILSCERIALILQGNDVLNPEQECTFNELIQRHARGEPIAYIIGKRAFFGRDFYVNEATLIPRPESEHLLEHILYTVPESPLHFADFGTGSGCLAITLLAERPLWQGIAFDISKEALYIAHKNAHTHGVLPRLQLVQASYLKPLLQTGSCDFIVANPPYISSQDYNQLDEHVRLFEPQNALKPPHSHATGLEHLASIIQQAKQYLKPNGLLTMEHAYNQGEAIQMLCKQHKWREIHTYQDLAGHDRILCARS